MIYPRFKSLDLKKQEEIINAGLKEFAENGFDKASTNRIVKDAGISKGSLFNYFNSKKEFYLYLIDHGMEFVQGLYEEIDLMEKDIFNRIGNIGIRKLKMYRGSPYVLDFLASVKLEESREVGDIISEKISLMYDRGMKEIYKNIDYSKFRDDIDIEKAIEILNWTMFGFGEKNIQRMDDFKDGSQFAVEALKEWEVYSNMLKDSFYK
ncbi:MAG: TetR/AcrR family transcriptional regulator [Tissierellia bacterium]|nr:TetR/AcrR family transcriptional regulator [Tissierellia bacterium]